VADVLPEVLREQLRRIQVQVVDRALELTFLKTVHRLPVPTGGALSVVRKRLFPLQPTRGVLVLVHGFGQNRYAWHTPRRSFVNYLAFRGYDVFNLELRGFGRSRGFGSALADHPDVHIEVDLPRAVDAALAISGAERVFLVGHSLGGACCYAAAPLVAERLQGVVTLAGLYRFAAVPGVLRLAAELVHYVDRVSRPSDWALPVHRVGLLLRTMQLALNSSLYRPIPFQAWYPGTIEPEILAYLHLAAYDRASLGVVRAIASWARRGRVTNRFGDDLLAAFDALDLPLLVVAASHDVLLPPSGAKPAYSQSQSRDKTFRVFGPDAGGHHWGHVDLILGRDAPAYVWPFIADWFDKRSAPTARS
jgi:polyhydroxyalkanoate synthase subunit PhaC